MDVMKCISKVNKQGVVMIQTEHKYFLGSFLSFCFCFWREASNTLCKGTTADANTEGTSKEARVDPASS